MLGLPPQETHTTAEALLGMVCPEDSERVVAAVSALFKGGHYDVEHRVRRADGSYLWIRSRGNVTARDAEGRALHVVGTNADITARRIAEQRLAEREAQLRQVIDSIPAMVTFVSPDERILFHNRRFREFMGLTAAEIDGQPVKEVVGIEGYLAIEEHLKTVLSGTAVRFEREVRGADGVERDVEVVYTPITDAEGQVAGAIAARWDITRLKELDRMKDRLVAVVSHELRTPLTAMRGSLGLLQGGIAGDLPAEATPLIEMAIANCERLTRLVNDLLDLEKLAAGAVTYRVEPLEVDTVIAQAIASCRGLIGSYGVGVEQVPGKLKVRGDSDRMIQVLTNLLFNAAKFSPRGSRVTVSAKREATAWVRTSVRDRGPGIPADFRARIFERFAQARMDDARPREGTGLGLAISREIVEQLGGRIGFHDAQGGGTVFWFDLPLAKD